MCPHGHHHNGSMATPAFGTQEVRLQGKIYNILFSVQSMHLLWAYD